LKRWYVVHTQARQETRAELNLRGQGFEAWLPVFRRVRRHARRIDHVLAPFFPRYLFVRLDLSIEPWRAINGTFGVIRLLCNRDTPLVVPEGLVEEIMERRDEWGTVLLSPRRLGVGGSVKVATGPFADLEGLFQTMSGRDHVVLLINLLGREVPASVPLSDLAA
jgi:transcriptional antiterminator RfaH